MSSSLCPKILKTTFLLVPNPFDEKIDGEYCKIWKPKINFLLIFSNPYRKVQIEMNGSCF